MEKSVDVSLPLNEYCIEIKKMDNNSQADASTKTLDPCLRVYNNMPGMISLQIRDFEALLGLSGRGKKFYIAHAYLDKTTAQKLIALLQKAVAAM